MRKDMAKVLCDEPRRGMRLKTRKGSKREDQRIPLDEKPVKPKGNLRREWTKGYENKEFGDHVEPLRRYIFSCIGRKWNDVYSEIRKTVPMTNVVNKHLYTHLYGYIALNVYIIDGKAYDADYSGVHYRYKRDLPIYQDTYVHPDTGIICRNEENFKPKNKKGPAPITWIGIDNSSAYYLHENIWYRMKFVEIPYWKKYFYAYDVMMKESFGWEERKKEIRPGYIITSSQASSTVYKFTKIYGKPIYCVSKQQAGKRDIKKIKKYLGEHV